MIGWNQIPLEHGNEHGSDVQVRRLSTDPSAQAGVMSSRSAETPTAHDEAEAKEPERCEHMGQAITAWSVACALATPTPSYEEHEADEHHEIKCLRLLIPVHKSFAMDIAASNAPTPAIMHAGLRWPPAGPTCQSTITMAPGIPVTASNVSESSDALSATTERAGRTSLRPSEWPPWRARWGSG